MGETEVLTQDAGAGTGESSKAQEGAAQDQNQTLHEMVVEEQGRDDEGKSVKNPADNGKARHLSAKDRIRQLNDQKNSEVQKRTDAEAKLSETEGAQKILQDELAAMKQELAKIGKMVASGQITKSEGKDRVNQAKDSLDDILRDIVVPDELAPWKTDIAKIADQIISKKIGQFEDRFKAMDVEQRRSEVESFRQVNLKNYSVIASEFPDLFDEPSEEGGLPELKPEYDKKAQELAGEYNEEFIDEDGEKAYFNRVLSSKSGLRMLFSVLAREATADKKAIDIVRNTQGKVEQARKMRVESSESNKGLPAKKQSLQEIVENTVKEFR